MPRLADWCAVYIRDGERIRTVAVARSNPKKVELAVESIRPALPHGSRREMRASPGSSAPARSQLTHRITREMVEKAAPDADFTRIIFDELGLRSALTVRCGRGAGSSAR